MSRVLVVDASVVVDLLGRFRPQPIEDLLWAPGTLLASPELMQVEVMQALRRLDYSAAIPATRSDIVASLAALRIRCYRHRNLLSGIWKLRRNLTAYDAAYVVLARMLGATLVTRDEHLAKAPGLEVRVAVP